MQTFLPYASFARSAAALDDRRLGRQRVEALQILRALHLEGYGWGHHPAVLMWRGFARALVAYGMAVTDEWSRRGWADTTRPMIVEFAAPRDAVPQERLGPSERPPWLGWSPLHRSHRSALVRKNSGFYGPRFPGVAGDQAYVWPEPPRPAAPLPPRSAWAVRASGPSQREAFRAHGAVGVPASLAAPAATPKQRRQLAAFLDAVAVGDTVAVVVGHARDGRGLLAGEVTGEPLTPPGAIALADLAAVRAVCWRGAVPRSALRRPYQVQDPQALFALRAEPALEDRA